MSESLLAILTPDSRKKSLLLDANLLLLWITSQYDLRLLQTFKRVQMFSQSDALLLAWIVDQFRSVITTAHVITEVGNLANALSSHTRLAWFSLLADFAKDTTEQSPSLKILADKQEFIPFGVTDSALVELADQHQVLTTDYPLSNYLRSAGKQVLNFRELRNAL